MLSVKQVAAEFGVNEKKIDYWTRKGILKTDFIDDSGNRFYSKEQIQKIMQRGILIIPKSVVK